MELAADISIFVGANNSGKTSATQAIQILLSGSKDRLSLFDFSSSVWKELNDLGESDATNDATATIPCIMLDLWLSVTQADLHLVIPILPSSKWRGTEVGVRVEFGPKNSYELLQRFRAKLREARESVAKLKGGAGDYVPWPRSLTEYLEKALTEEFEFRYFVLNRAEFDSDYIQNSGYVPSQLSGEPGGASILKGLIRVDCLNAQRHLADPSSNSSGGLGRAEDLSRRLSRFYQRNLKQRDEDHTALKALFESETGLDKHLMDVFEPTLSRIADLGYPGLNNPRMEIKSSLNPATVMSQDARVHYILGNGKNGVRLPDSYNGLGFKNLIYMVVEILDLQAKWAAEEDKRSPLHLIFIEEPEAHLHAQLQQVFIRNVLRLLSIDGETDGTYSSQVVITTHSPHILYERGFTPIRYFRRHITDDGEQSSVVLNLSSFQKGPNPKDRDFLQRYLKLTHCALFFSDGAILVEGNVERLLLPLMIEKTARSLRSASLCILEVGGAFGHRFKELIEFLGITTLIITDLDSVTAVAEPDPESEDEEKEFEVPAEGGQPATKHYGTTCLPSVNGAVTANQTLIQWLPAKRTIAELLDANAESKVQVLIGSTSAEVCVAYQVKTPVTWGGKTVNLCGRTLEEAFGLENAEWCQMSEQRSIGLKLKSSPASSAELAERLHQRVTGSNFDKTKFALEVLARKPEDWVVPKYIKDGLVWLKEQIDIEIEQEAEAVADAISESESSSPARTGSEGAT